VCCEGSLSVTELALKKAVMKIYDPNKIGPDDRSLSGRSKKSIEKSRGNWRKLRAADAGEEYMESQWQSKFQKLKSENTWDDAFN
jgi:hypothetical protein